MSTAASKKVGRNLAEGPILSTLLIFAIPIVLTNLIQQLYSMVDLIIIGQFVGSNGTVGVSIGGEVSDLMTPIATSFSTAGQIYLAQLIGAQETKKSKQAIGTLFTTMMVLSILFAVICIGLHKQILNLLNCPSQAYTQAAQYLIITSLGLPFIFGYNAVCGVLRAMGESKRPMYFIIIAAIVNIVSDLALVVVFHMDAAGTAIATTLSQIGAFLAAFYYMYRHRTQFEFELRPSFFKIDWQCFKLIMVLGIPQLAKTILVRFSMLWVNANLNAYGLTVSATNSIGNKIQKFCEVFILGIDTAAGAMVGQCLGARKQDRAARTIWWSFGSCLLTAILAVFICTTWPKAVFGIFTTDSEVLEYGVIYLHITWIHFLISAVTGPFQAMVTGCGNVSLGFFVGVLDGFICRIGLSLIFTRILHMEAIGYFWGTALSRTLPALLVLVYFLSGKWRSRKLLSD